jgi:translation initiation factor 2B subunit (eIF-2B alpha/beta/delta family)
MAARHAGTPVYVVGSLMKVDESNSVKIERRAGKELRQEAPK